MTRCEFFTEDDRITGFSVSGHSGYAEAEATVKFEQVLAVLDGENTKIGAPVVEGAAVEAKVVKNGKGKKIDIIRYKAKKGEKRHIGHRQPYTKVEITKIAL